MDLIAKLTAKDEKYACAIADQIISESQESDKWYGFFDVFATLFNHPKSLVRNRALYILAANAQWDDEKRFDSIIPDLLLNQSKRIFGICFEQQRKHGEGGFKK